MKKDMNKLGKVVVGGTVVTSLIFGNMLVAGDTNIYAYEFERKEDVVTLKKDDNGEIKKLEEVKYLVIHETANEGSTADADAHYNLVNNAHDSYVYSYAFVVDENKAIQMAPMDARTTHTKSGNGITNNNAIGIEMCVNAGASYEDTVKNTIKLVRDVILKEYPNIQIVQHYDAYGKDCPSKLRKSGKWDDFVAAIYDERKTEVVLGWEEEQIVETETVVASASSETKDYSNLSRKERKLKEKEDKITEIETLLSNKKKEFEDAKTDLSKQKEDKVTEINNLEKSEIKKIENEYNKQIKELENKMKSEISKKSSEFDKKEAEELKVIEENFNKSDEEYKKEIDKIQKNLEKAEKEYEKQIEKNKSIIEKLKDINFLNLDNDKETENKKEVKEVVLNVVQNENIELQKEFQKSLGITPEIVETKEVVEQTKTEVESEEKEDKGLFSFLFKDKALYDSTNVLEKSKIKKKDLEKALKDMKCKQLIGFADTFVEMEKEYGFNAVILTAMAINDTKKGGDLYNSDEKIEEMVNKIVNKYIKLDKEAEWLYVGSSDLKDIGTKYAPENSEWVDNVLKYAKQIKK